MVPVDILEVAMQTKQKKRINHGHSLNRIYITHLTTSGYQTRSFIQCHTCRKI